MSQPSSSSQTRWATSFSAIRNRARPAGSVWWLVASAALSVWVISTVGGFDLFTTVETPGGVLTVVNTFAAVDHPFHAARAEMLQESLGNGSLPRWIAHHHGGYPVDFYPLGIAWLEVALAGLLLNSIPIIAVHKLVVLLIFLAPGIGFWLLARGDRLTAGVAFLGLCLQVAIPGDWTHGGYTELVQWGLITNVGGATAVLIAAAALARYALAGSPWMLAIAVGMSAWAAYVNPRSLLGLAVAALAIWLSALLPSREVSHERRPIVITRRIGVAALLAVLLAAPELGSLLRFRDLYAFLHYQAYTTLRVYWDASVEAVSPPVFAVAVVGGMWSVVSPRFPVARAVALATIGYVVMTVVLTDSGMGTGLIQQLETPRLMPFQRLLLLYLAAFGAVLLVTKATAWVRLPALAPALITLVGVGAVVATVLPLPAVPMKYRSLYEVEETGSAEFQTFRDAVAAADAAAPPGTSILVIGSRLSWHEQLWAPLETDHPLFYDDWLWYWHDRHEGPYLFSQGHFYPQPAGALTRSYFDTHAVGAVVVTDRPLTDDDEQRVAAEQPDLTPVVRGVWDVYSVIQPTTIATIENTSADRISVEPERIVAEFELAEGGELIVRHNWFPRWEATVNGDPAPIVRRADGYMAVQAPAGRVELELRYGLQSADWLARFAAAVGAVMLLALMVPDRWWPARFHSWSPGAPAMPAKPMRAAHVAQSTGALLSGDFRVDRTGDLVRGGEILDEKCFARLGDLPSHAGFPKGNWLEKPAAPGADEERVHQLGRHVE